MWSPTVPLSVENEAMLGAAGATVSIVTLIATEAALVTPDTVSVAVKLCTPSGKATVIKLQAPLALAVAVPSSVVPSYTFTVEFATAVPVSVRMAGSVMPSPTTPVSGENEVMVGAARRLCANRCHRDAVQIPLEGSCRASNSRTSSVRLQ